MMDNRCRLARTGDTICHTDGVRLPDCWMLPASSSRPSSTNWPSRSICPSNRFFQPHIKAALPSTPQRCQDRAAFPFYPLLWGSPKWAAYVACNNNSFRIIGICVSLSILESFSSRKFVTFACEYNLCNCK